jgi:hypothetical protein
VGDYSGISPAKAGHYLHRDDQRETANRRTKVPRLRYCGSGPLRRQRGSGQSGLTPSGSGVLVVFITIASIV